LTTAEKKNGAPQGEPFLGAILVWERQGCDTGPPILGEPLDGG
jgi:hypothetical protein